MHILVEAPLLHEQRVPVDVPIGTRVEGLWEYDVVELFLVGPGHRYLEIELGAGGHFLVLAFDRIRHRSNGYEDLKPFLSHHKTTNKTWVSEIVLPTNLLPDNIRALNAFVFAAGQYLAYSALPGDKPDFHQPDFYPVASIY